MGTSVKFSNAERIRTQRMATTHYVCLFLASSGLFRKGKKNVSDRDTSSASAWRQKAMQKDLNNSENRTKRTEVQEITARDFC